MEEYIHYFINIVGSKNHVTTSPDINTKNIPVRFGIESKMFDNLVNQMLNKATIDYAFPVDLFYSKYMLENSMCHSLGERGLVD